MSNKYCLMQKCECIISCTTEITRTTMRKKAPLATRTLLCMMLPSKKTRSNAHLDGIFQLFWWTKLYCKLCSLSKRLTTSAVFFQTGAFFQKHCISKWGRTLDALDDCGDLWAGRAPTAHNFKCYSKKWTAAEKILISTPSSLFFWQSAALPLPIFFNPQTKLRDSMVLFFEFTIPFEWRVTAAPYRFYNLT